MTGAFADRNQKKGRALKPVPPSAFDNPQLSLFQGFLANSDSERTALSNAVDLWDSIPRFSISRKRQEELRLAGGYLPVRKVAFQYKGIALTATIRAARLEERDSSGKLTGQTVEYYPSAREELIEHALRRMAAAPREGFYDEMEQRSGLTFTLYRLRQELAQQGHAMTFRDLADGLDVLSLSTIDLEGGKSNDAGALPRFARSPYFPKLGGIRRSDLERDPDAKWYVEFHPAITASIDNLTYRQFNYQRLMKCRTQIARWLLSQIVLKYTAAAITNTFDMHFSTIKRDSGLLEGYKLQRQAIAAVDEAWEELKALDALNLVKKTEQRGPRGKIEDVVYRLYPSRQFSMEQKAANHRLHDARARAFQKPIHTALQRPVDN